MTINDNSIFDTETPLRRIEPSRTRVVVYTTYMEEGRNADIKQTEIGAGSANGGDDYSQYSKEVSVNYLSNKTHEAKNLYPINKGSNPVILRNADGTPASLTNSEQAAEKQYSDEFISNDSQKALNKFKNLSESEFLELQVKKGKGLNGTLPSVNELYDEIELSSEGNQGLLVSTVENRLAENNQFYPKQRFISSDETRTEQNTQVGTILLQPKFGVHSPRKFPTAETGNLNGDGENISLSSDELKRLGVNILFAAAGDNPLRILSVKGALQEIAPGVFGSNTLEDAGKDAQSLARIGVKVPVNRFSPTEIIAATNPDFVKPKNSIALDSETQYSHGNPYNPEFIFSSLDSAKSAAFMISIVSVLCIGISETQALYASIPFAGQYIQNRFFINTINPYNICVKKGLEIFFSPLTSGTYGIDSGKEIGFGNTIARILIKQIYQDLGIENTENIDPLNIVTKISTFHNSRIVKFMNIVANLGDNSLTQDTIFENENEKLSDKTDVYSYTKESLITDTFQEGNGEDFKINPAALIYKTFLSPNASRLAGGRKVQAIATNTTPSRYILPKSLDRADIRINLNPGKVISNLRLSNGFNSTDLDDNSRLSSTIVNELEKKLDASYVPFYMHDLRTNEIISFHAFLESLSDNFSPNYTATDGYGRIEAVQTYTGTKRDISFDFFIVATNKNDFDEMWWKINKLTTFLYPQFTQGRNLRLPDETKFIQPFSQLPGASPLIRLRIGDVIRSNFSGFNLARLFGIAESEESFVINDANAAAAAASASTYNENLQQQINTVSQRMREGIFAPGESFKVQFNLGSAAYRDTIRTFAASIRGQSGIIAPQGLALVGDSTMTESQRIRKERQILRNIPSGQWTLEVVEEDTANWLYKVRFKNPIPSSLINSSDQFYIRNIVFPFIPIPEEITRIARRLASDSPESTVDTQSNTSNVRTFLSKTQNPIFKSFETTKGKGLAGFITNMSFNWIEGDTQIWEVDGLNNRAPKMCKIRISFVPVHDIAPGIDSNGFNRAPIYPVGNISTATSFDLEQDSDTDMNYNNKIAAIKITKEKK